VSPDPDLSLVSVEQLLDELARRFDGYVFLARVITNERHEDQQPIVSWYEAFDGDVFVTAGLARMLVKMTDKVLKESVDVACDAAQGAAGDDSAAAASD